LESFQDFNVGGGISAPELYTIGPDEFENYRGVVCWWRKYMGDMVEEIKFKIKKSSLL
jgi:hypothetical protein